MDKDDIDDFIMYITGYCKVLLEKEVEVNFDRSACDNELVCGRPFAGVRLSLTLRV